MLGSLLGPSSHACSQGKVHVKIPRIVCVGSHDFSKAVTSGTPVILSRTRHRDKTNNPFSKYVVQSMSEQLNVIALISGGKDSLYSLLHCVQNGHNVVALANLHPPLESRKEDDDMNSYMYQTVGHEIIPLYATALDIPLFRREISGSAVQTGRYYDTSSSNGTAHDETEDLCQLLEEVKKAHPTVNAVSSGAILSTYQRTRVESVAIRLGLVPLAYLWQYPALPPSSKRVESISGLLDDMAAARCDARMIKIATGGLKDSMLWTNVADPKTRQRLIAGMAPFFPDQPFWLRGAVLGEGGEYETLALDGPYPVWKKRLHVDSSDVHTITGEGGVHHVQLAKVSLIEKDAGTPTLAVRYPSWYDAQFENIRAQLQPLIYDPPIEKVSESQRLPLELPRARISSSPTHTIVTNYVAEDFQTDAAAQMKDIASQITRDLGQLSPSITSSATTFTLLQVASMSDFPIINPIYASLFPTGEPNPPARVTIASDLPIGVKVSLSMTLHRGPRSDRRGLHVQSRSYWAPANIGPYSQAICESIDGPVGDLNIHDAARTEVVHVAGQIPLIPHSMELSEASFEDQTVLSLQHLWRVGQERGVDFWPWGVAFIYLTDDLIGKVSTAAQAWSTAHQYHLMTDEDDTEDNNADQDVWYQQQHRGFTSPATTPTATSDHLHKLPNPTLMNSIQPRFPPLLIAEVVSLPRAAPIEWWSLGLTNLTADSQKLRWGIKTWSWGVSTGVFISSPTDEGGAEHVFLSLLIRDASQLESGMREALRLALGATISHTFGLEGDESKWEVVHGTAFHAAKLYGTKGHIEGIHTATVPCRGLWGSVDVNGDGDAQMEKLDMALVLRLRRSED
jgi:diphthine-ammonia ligase